MVVIDTDACQTRCSILRIHTVITQKEIMVKGQTLVTRTTLITGAAAPPGK